MTEDSHPTDNAIAERVNGTIKGEGIYPRKAFNSLEHARNVIERYIHFYNYRRPHMSIGYKVPALVHMEEGPQKKMWRNKIYKKKEGKVGNNEIHLPSQTNNPDDSFGHHCWIHR